MQFKKNKIIDLTIADKITFDSLNHSLENSGQAIKSKVFKNPFLFQDNKMIEKEFKKYITSWFGYTYAKLLSDQIFIPIKTKNKKFEYAPFQIIANYFNSLGYVGIIYGSTVCTGAKNLVLFDKEIAEPVGMIKDYII